MRLILQKYHLLDLLNILIIQIILTKRDLCCSNNIENQKLKILILEFKTSEKVLLRTNHFRVSKQPKITHLFKKNSIWLKDRQIK
jgi:hypothetical protein